MIEEPSLTILQIGANTTPDASVFNFVSWFLYGLPFASNVGAFTLVSTLFPGTLSTHQILKVFF